MLIPTGHRLIVKPDPLDEFHPGTTIVQVNLDERLTRAAQDKGTVVSIGPDCWKAFRKVQDGKEVNGQPWAQVGDRIYYSRHAGKSMIDPETEEEYVVLNDEDVAVVIVEESKND